MGQVVQDKPYSNTLSNNYLSKQQMRNEEARQKALKALKATKSLKSFK